MESVVFPAWRMTEALRSGLLSDIVGKTSFTCSSLLSSQTGKVGEIVGGVAWGVVLGDAPGVLTLTIPPSVSSIVSDTRKLRGLCSVLLDKRLIPFSIGSSGMPDSS